MIRPPGPGSWLLAPPPLSGARVLEAPPGQHQGPEGSEDTDCETFMQVSFWLRQELKESQSSSVRPSDSNLSRALNLHYSGSGLSQVSLRSLIALSFSSLTLLGNTDGT